jgi:Sulfate permease family
MTQLRSGRGQATAEGAGRPARGRSISMLDGIRPYQRSWLRADIVAGITLAALAIPEVMGYTKIAGMPVITGLYTDRPPDPVVERAA